MLIPVLFLAFGALCGLWLSVVGLLVTTVGLVFVCGLVSALVGWPLSPWMLFSSAVALQFGYFVSLATRIAVAHIVRLRLPKRDRAQGKRSTEFAPKLNPDQEATLDRR